MAKIKQKNIGKYHALGLPNQIAQIVGPVDEYTDDENAWCLIYERDIRGKFTRYFNPASFDGIGECSNSWTYVSAQSPYGDMNLHWVWWNSSYNSLGSKTIDCNLNNGGNILVFNVYR